MRDARARAVLDTAGRPCYDAFRPDPGYKACLASFSDLHSLEVLVSKPELVNVLTKMRRDKQYRAVVRSDPETALLRADLTEDERTALTAWDPARLEAIGVGAELAREALFGHDPFGSAATVGAGVSHSGASGCG